MRELQTLAAELLAQPLCPTPPIEQVVARARRYRRHRRRRTGTLVAFAVVTVVAAGRNSSYRR